MEKSVFNELNQLPQGGEFSIDTYFDKMELTEKEKEERKDFANEMKNALLFIFALYLTMQQYDYINKQYIIEQLQKRYSDAVIERMEIDDYLSEMIIDSARDIVDTTFRHDDEEYFTSEERAELIACNSANDTLNYKQYADAVKAGKKNKQWITEKDNRVRRTHEVLDDEVIPIGDTFLVGDTLMRFPHDTYYGVDYKELSNCRCTVKYF